jgi:hypothetical protein
LVTGYAQGKNKDRKWQRNSERLEQLELSEVLRRRIAEAHEDLAACPTLDEFVAGLE